MLSAGKHTIVPSVVKPGTQPGFFKGGVTEATHQEIADYIWFIPLLSLVYQRAQSYYRGMKALIN